MDLDIVLPIVRRALDTDGRFAVWRNVFGDPSVPTTPFRERVEAIVRRRRSAPRPGPDPQDLAATAANLTRHDLFEVEDLSTYRWMLDLTTGQVRNLFSTFSGWSHDDVDRAAEAVDELGGSIVEHYTSWLIVLRPRLATRS